MHAHPWALRCHPGGRSYQLRRVGRAHLRAQPSGSPAAVKVVAACAPAARRAQGRGLTASVGSEVTAPGVPCAAARGARGARGSPLPRAAVPVVVRHTRGPVRAGPLRPAPAGRKADPADGAPSSGAPYANPLQPACLSAALVGRCLGDCNPPESGRRMAGWEQPAGTGLPARLQPAGSPASGGEAKRHGPRSAGHGVCP